VPAGERMICSRRPGGSPHLLPWPWIRRQIKASCAPASTPVFWLNKASCAFIWWPAPGWPD
jgi:hypothetical protein